MNTIFSDNSQCLRLPDIPSAKPVLTSYHSGWESMSLEYFRQPQGEVSELYFTNYVIGINIGQACPMRIECLSESRQHEGTSCYGTMTLCTIYESYKVNWSQDLEALVLNLQADLLSRNAQELIESDSFELLSQFVIHDPLILQIGLALKADLELQRLGGRLYAEHMANALAVHLLRAYGSQTCQSISRLDGSSHSQLKPVFDYIQDFLDQDLSLATLAKIANLSQYHFSRTFKKITGFTPHQYVLRQRIEKAKQLLRYGKVTISEVALTCGFTHQSHLNYHFKKLVGVTPSKFIQQ